MPVSVPTPDELAAVDAEAKAAQAASDAVTKAEKALEDRVTALEAKLTTPPVVVPPTPTNPLSALPTKPWYGGPSYWSQFARANGAGWSDPNFFPISVFYGKPSHAAALKAAVLQQPQVFRLALVVQVGLVS